ncbi:MAG: NH(3)-dependent synthetase [Symbiobacteriaceae bacterium]|jgi:NAD+ synthase|nr:NH(3)-dependent synthetase [Symbiobacteriaceae bacterium]
MSTGREHRIATFAERAAGERSYMEKSGIKTLINSLSGGVDSTVSALISKEATPEGSIGLILPCSPPEELQGERQQDIVDGQRVADHLGIPAVVINLSDLWAQAVALYTEAAREMAAKRGVPLDEAKLKWAVNNLKPTLRMMTAGFFADAFQGLMMGTDNAIENFLGYFSIRGDGVADRQPIRDCTKAEVRDLAAAGGFAEDLVKRVPTAGLWPGQTDEGELGFSYDEADRFFLWLVEKHLSTPVMDEFMTVKAEAVAGILADPTLPVSAESARKIIAQNRRTAFKRKSDDLRNLLLRRGLIEG